MISVNMKKDSALGVLCRPRARSRKDTPSQLSGYSVLEVINTTIEHSSPASSSLTLTPPLIKASVTPRKIPRQRLQVWLVYNIPARGWLAT